MLHSLFRDVRSKVIHQHQQETLLASLSSARNSQKPLTDLNITKAHVIVPPLIKPDNPIVDFYS